MEVGKNSISGYSQIPQADDSYNQSIDRIYNQHSIKTAFISYSQNCSLSG